MKCAVLQDVWNVFYVAMNTGGLKILFLQLHTRTFYIRLATVLCCSLRKSFENGSVHAHEQFCREFCDRLRGVQ